MIRRQLTRLAVMAVLGLGRPLAALGQSDYPSKPVKIIVPFPPGGTSDVMGRMVADELTKILKQPFIIENIGGAGGVIGSERAAKMAPDGYTLLLTGVGSNAVAHGLDPKLAYDSVKDFTHLAQIHSGPNVLVVHPDRPIKTFQELVGRSGCTTSTFGPLWICARWVKSFTESYASFGSRPCATAFWPTPVWMMV